MPNFLGEKIKKHRLRKKYSLDKLAELTQSSKSYLWELENKESKKPSAQKLTKIAMALDVSSDYLMDDSEEPDDDVLKESLYRNFKKLSPEDQEVIKETIERWSKKHS